ncbi:hypothetical protein ACRRTK_003574 [Alexandromys fortis]
MGKEIAECGYPELPCLGLVPSAITRTYSGSQADLGLAVWDETQEAAATAAAMCQGSVPMDLVPWQPYLARGGQGSVVPFECGHLGETGGCEKWDWGKEQYALEERLATPVSSSRQDFSLAVSSKASCPCLCHADLVLGAALLGSADIIFHSDHTPMDSTSRGQHRAQDREDIGGDSRSRRVAEPWMPMLPLLMPLAELVSHKKSLPENTEGIERPRGDYSCQSGWLSKARGESGHARHTLRDNEQGLQTLEATVEAPARCVIWIHNCIGMKMHILQALKFKACPKPYHGVEKWEFETGLEGDSKRRPPGEGVETGPLKGDFSSSKGALASCTIPGKEVLEAWGQPLAETQPKALAFWTIQGFPVSDRLPCPQTHHPAVRWLTVDAVRPPHPDQGDCPGVYRIELKVRRHPDVNSGFVPVAGMVVDFECAPFSIVRFLQHLGETRPRGEPDHVKGGFARYHNGQEMKDGSHFLGRLLGVSHGCLKRRLVLEEGQSEVHFQCGKRPERGSQGKQAVPIEQVNLNGLIPQLKGLSRPFTHGQLKQLNGKNSVQKRGVVHRPTPPFGMPGVGLRAQPGTCQEVQTRAIQDQSGPNQSNRPGAGITNMLQHAPCCFFNVLPVLSTCTRVHLFKVVCMQTHTRPQAEVASPSQQQLLEMAYLGMAEAPGCGPLRFFDELSTYGYPNIWSGHVLLGAGQPCVFYQVLIPGRGSWECNERVRRSNSCGTAELAEVTQMSLLKDGIQHPGNSRLNDIEESESIRKDLETCKKQKGDVEGVWTSDGEGDTGLSSDPKIWTCKSKAREKHIGTRCFPSLFSGTDVYTAFLLGTDYTV